MARFEIAEMTTSDILKILYFISNILFLKSHDYPWKQNLSSQSISIQFSFTMATEVQFLDAQSNKDETQNCQRKMGLKEHHVYLWTTETKIW